MMSDVEFLFYLMVMFNLGMFILFAALVVVANYGKYRGREYEARDIWEDTEGLGERGDYCPDWERRR